MSVRNLVADDLAQDPISVECFPLRLGDLRHSLEIRSDAWSAVPVGRNIPDPAVMLLGYDLDVADGMRVDVEERHEVVVFIDDMGGDLFTDDLAEDAIIHVDILA